MVQAFDQFRTRFEPNLPHVHVTGGTYGEGRLPLSQVGLA